MSPGVSPFRVLQAMPKGNLKLDTRRSRIQSEEVPFFSGMASPMPVMETAWSTKAYDSLDERLDSLIDYLNTEKDNMALLISEFDSYYFDEAPNIPSMQLKRLFFGPMG